MSNEINEQGYELDWDAEIENDGSDYTVLPEGDYPFIVTGFERARHPGSEKLPPCGKAVLTIQLLGSEGIATIKHNLFLHSKTEGILCAFFVAIGQRQKGEKSAMDWNKVINSTGKAKVGVRNWTNDKGETRQSNEIKKFYEPEAKASYTPGRF